MILRSRLLILFVVCVCTPPPTLHLLRSFCVLDVAMWHRNPLSECFIRSPLLYAPIAILAVSTLFLSLFLSSISQHDRLEALRCVVPPRVPSRVVWRHHRLPVAPPAQDVVAPVPTAVPCLAIRNSSAPTLRPS